MNGGGRRSIKPIWLVGGIVGLGLIVLLAGPVSSVTSDRSEPLFAERPDSDELERLGTFAANESGDERSLDAAAGGDGEASLVEAVGVETVGVETVGVETVAAAGAAQAAAPAGAGEGASAETGAGTDSSTSIIGAKVGSFSTGDIFDLLWRLALVGGIIWLSIFLLRKFVARSGRTQSNSGALKVLETIGLANNRLISLLEAGDRVLVVGSTPTHVALLAELDDPEVVSALRSDADRTSPKVATLGEMMRGYGERAGHQFSRRFSRPRAERSAGASEPGGDLTPILQQLLKAQAEIALSAERLERPSAATAAPSPAGSEGE